MQTFARLEVVLLLRGSGVGSTGSPHHFEKKGAVLTGQPVAEVGRKGLRGREGGGWTVGRVSPAAFAQPSEGVGTRDWEEFPASAEWPSQEAGLPHLQGELEGDWIQAGHAAALALSRAFA
jgi:hypothetical protein